MASLTCGTVNFGRGVFENPAPLMLEFARAQLAAGVKPELEIFDAGHLDNAALAGRQGAAGRLRSTTTWC